jgi:hypothetical protein
VTSAASARPCGPRRTVTFQRGRVCAKGIGKVDRSDRRLAIVHQRRTYLRRPHSKSSAGRARLPLRWRSRRLLARFRLVATACLRRYYGCLLGVRFISARAGVGSILPTRGHAGSKMADYLSPSGRTDQWSGTPWMEYHDRDRISWLFELCELRINSSTNGTSTRTGHRVAVSLGPFWYSTRLRDELPL